MTIWKQRNSILFNKIQVNVQLIPLRIQFLLNIFHLVSNLNMARSGMVWDCLKPSLHWFEIDAYEALCKSDFGSHYQKSWWGRVWQIGYGRAVRRGLELALEERWNQVIIEGGCKECASYCRSIKLHTPSSSLPLSHLICLLFQHQTKVMPLFIYIDRCMINTKNSRQMHNLSG